MGGRRGPKITPGLGGMPEAGPGAMAGCRTAGVGENEHADKWAELR